LGKPGNVREFPSAWSMVKNDIPQLDEEEAAELALNKPL